MGQGDDRSVRPRVAYSVQGDESGVIRFARSGAAARREGASEMDMDWEAVVSCRRAPEFDSYAEAGAVPEEALWKAGWRFYCCRCDATALDDGLCQMVQGRAYCSDHAPDTREVTKGVSPGTTAPLITPEIQHKDEGL